MEGSAFDIKSNNSNLVSRNAPLAFVVGVATPLGSWIADLFLGKRVQVIGIDALADVNKDNLENCAKYRQFHFFDLGDSGINEGLEKLIGEASLKCEYGVFIPNTKNNSHEMKFFLNHCLKLGRPKIALVSDIRLYGRGLDRVLKALKNLEIIFSKFVSENKVNGRIVRLSHLYGPRMDLEKGWSTDELLEASFDGTLADYNTSLDGVSRELYLKDAGELVIKTLMAGETSMKIYDGVRKYPLRVEEIRRCLLHIKKDERFEFSQQNIWPTPNFRKTIEELSWKEKTGAFESFLETVEYFKKNSERLKVKEEQVPEEIKIEDEERSDQVKTKNFWSEHQIEIESQEKVEPLAYKKRKGFGALKVFVYLSLVSLLVYGLFWPFGKLVGGAFNFARNVEASSDSLERGEIGAALQRMDLSVEGINNVEGVFSSFEIARKFGFNGNILILEVVDALKEGVESMRIGLIGLNELEGSGRIISGESSDNAAALYEKARMDLRTARERLSACLLSLELLGGSSLPGVVKSRLEEFEKTVEQFKDVVEGAELATLVLPLLTGVEGERSYGVLLLNEGELRAGGGVVLALGLLEFREGKLINTNAQPVIAGDIPQPSIVAPKDVAADLGLANITLSSIAYDADFPIVASQAMALLRSKLSKNLDGLVALNIQGLSRLLDSVGGVSIDGKSITGANLMEYLFGGRPSFDPTRASAVMGETLKKTFFLSEGWGDRIGVLGASLEEGDIRIYVVDRQTSGYLSAEGWSGLVPRAREVKNGEVEDFVEIVESNIGGNLANLSVLRDISVNGSLDKDLTLSHKIDVKYKGDAISVYKARVKVYLPAGSILNKASFGVEDITSKVVTYSDYGRVVVSLPLTLLAGEEKLLSLSYRKSTPVEFLDNTLQVNVLVAKQSGYGKPGLRYSLVLGEGYKFSSVPEGASVTKGRIEINTVLDKDKSFPLKITR